MDSDTALQIALQAELTAVALRINSPGGLSAFKDVDRAWANAKAVAGRLMVLQYKDRLDRREAVPTGAPRP